METIGRGIIEALRLIFSADEEIFEIVGLSLYVSLFSVCIAAVMGIPLGTLIGMRDFRFKGLVVRLMYTFMSLPPVIAGLTVFLILMRRGPLGSLQLNYSVPAMIIAQVCIVFPVIAGITYNMVKEKAHVVDSLGFTLGADKLQRVKLFIFDMRVGISAAIVSGFGRAISEVGSVMIVGGNIKGKTRVMTTYITELKGMGNYDRAIAVGLILLLIAFIVNALLYHFQERESR